MSRQWQVAIFGTFDVANYGDLLFPILAQAELTRRLGPGTLQRFSYHEKTTPQWPYPVTSVSRLPELAGQLDAVLIGGGFIVRFDKFVAADYYPPTPTIHHPTGYWLTPALIALQHGIPLVWNAPGMHCNDVPGWATPLVKLALEHSAHIRVRDALTQSTLSAVAGTAPIEVLPDTAFGLPRLLDLQSPSPALLKARADAGLTKPYLVVHAIQGLDSFLHLWRTHAAQFEDLELLLLPIGPVLGDHESVLGDDLARARRLPYWPDPLLLAELIAHSEGVVGHSYHLAISGLAFGLPVFCSADLDAGKYTALHVYDRLFQVRWDLPMDAHWLRAQLGRRPVSSALSHAVEAVDAHWDRVAEIIRQGLRPTQPALNHFWQTLPNLLETPYLQNQALMAEGQQQREQAQQQLDELKQYVATLEQQREQQQHDDRARRAHIDQLLSEQRHSHLAIEQLRREQSNSALTIEQLRAAQVHSTQTIEQLHAEQTHLTQTTDQLHATLNELRQANGLAEQQLETLRNSNSFKVTAPLRGIRRGLNKLLGTPSA